MYLIKLKMKPFYGLKSFHGDAVDDNTLTVRRPAADFPRVTTQLPFCLPAMEPRARHHIWPGCIGSFGITGPVISLILNGTGGA